MTPTSPVLVLYGPGDADWAACLMLDLRARGVDVVDGNGDADRAVHARQEEPGAIVVVRSWFGAGGVEPSPDVVEAVLARNGPYVVVRSTATKLGRDDYPGRTNTFALWDRYFQPVRGRAGKGSQGFANLLDVLPRSRTTIDLQGGYVFISYHFDSDGDFVHNGVRPVLSRAGLTSWAYRTSERITEAEGAASLGPRALSPSVRERLAELVPCASVLLVVSTREWWSPGADLEVRIARRHGIPVIAVQPPDVGPSRRSILAGAPSLTLDSNARSAKALVAALTDAGARPLAPR